MIARAWIVALAPLTFACGGTIEGRSGDAAANAEASYDDASADVTAPLDASLGDAPVADAGTPFDAASIDAAEALPCIGQSYVFHVEGRGGYPGIPGPLTVTGADGTWSAGLISESALDLKVLATNAWAMTASSDFVQGQSLVPGTYDAMNPTMGAWIQVQADGGGCPGVPHGTFTIAEIESTGGDEANVTKLFMWFDVTCVSNGTTSTLTGCVSYGN